MPTLTNNPTRCVIYARVSTDEQAQHGTSLDDQVRRCRQWADEQGCQVVGTFADAGISGSLASRPKLDEMISTVRRGEAGIVLVAKLDRLGRSVSHLATLLDELDRAGVRVVSLSENLDSSSSSGRLARNIAAVFAEYERSVIRDRMVAGQRRVVADGFWPGGPPPYGFRVSRGDNRHSLLVVDETEGEVVRYLAECLTERHMSTTEAAHALSQAGYSTRSGGVWQARDIRHVVRSAGRSWCGEWSYDGTKMTVSAILDQATVAQAMAALDRRSTGRRPRRHEYLLTGRLMSPHGLPMWGTGTVSGTRTYFCSGTDSAVANGDRCQCKNVVADVVEAAVWSEVVRVLSDPDELRRRAEVALAPEQSGGEVAAIRRRVSRAEAALAHAIAQTSRLGLDDNAAALAVRALSDDLTAARQSLAQVERWSAANDAAKSRAERVWRLAENARSVLAARDFATRRRIVDLLDVRVQVTGVDRCDVCSGKGVLPVPLDAEGRRPKGWHGFSACYSCRRTKHQPVLEICGVVPDAPALGEVVAGSGHRFRVVS